MGHRVAVISALLISPVSCFAGELWDAPAFSTPAADLVSAAARLKPDKPNDVLVVLDENRYALDGAGRLTHTRRALYRVDSPQGVEQWAAVGSYWEPWHQKRPQIRARVITPDGQEHPLDPKLLADTPVRNDMPLLYDDARLYQGPLPAVSVGAVVETEVVSQDSEPFFSAGSIIRVSVGKYVPVLHTRIVIDAPAELPVHHVTRLLPDATVRESRSGDHVTRLIEHGALPAIEEVETNLPGDVAPWPQVEISTGSSWQQVAQTYFNMTEPRIRLEDVKRVVPSHAPDESPLQIAQRLVDKLHREVRYTGVEFGQASLIPQYPGETLTRKFGDCKDKGVVLVAMLRASGIPAYLALLGAGPGQDVDPALPGLGLFDHAIVYIPGKTDLWIDATAEYTRVGDLPEGDRGRLALVIRDSTTELIRTPVAEPIQNLILEQREFHLAEHGPAQIIETTQPHGSAESEYRASFSGPAKDATRKNLEDYVKATYVAEGLTKYERLGADNLVQPFQLRLEVHNGSRGFTTKEDAAVAIPISGIGERLPGYFDERRQDSDKSRSTGTDSKHARTADVVFEPFVTEWQYRIIPPTGFRARALPANSVKDIGPAKLTQEFAIEPDGVVTARLRFDTAKARYTVAEASALRDALKELRAAEPVFVTFDLTAHALVNSGDYRGGIKAYEDIVALHPREALHHVQMATALLHMGLGERARREAQAATRLEPKSSLAWATLGWVLQHDLIGRLFGKGFDLDASIAAYRKAKALDPSDAQVAGNLAILLEYDADGVRYSPRARLDEAIAEYRARQKLIKEDDRDSLENDLPFALFYAGKFDEVKASVAGKPANEARKELLLASLAASAGAKAALDESYRLAANETERSKLLAAASRDLMNARTYGPAADLLAASVQGQADGTTVVQQQVDLIRATRRHEDAAAAANDPRFPIQRLLVLALSSEIGPSETDELLSRRSHDGTPSRVERLGLRQFVRAIRQGAERTGLAHEAITDVVLAAITYNIEGDDASGYRVNLQVRGASPMEMFVVKEDGHYRLLGSKGDVSGLGVLALERLSAEDLDGARRWLDWARDSQHLEGGDDPLAGPAFPRVWRKGQTADRATLEIAAAALAVTNKKAAASAVDVLNAALNKAQSNDARVSLELALAHGYMTLEKWQALRDVSLELLKATPDSRAAFSFVERANNDLGQWDDMEARARERLALLPDDSLAVEILAQAAEGRHDFGKIRGLLRPLVSSPRATVQDYNQFAWYALLAPPVDQEVIDAARRAYEQSQGRAYGVTHTLACIYAVAGKSKEARELLLQALNSSGLDEPNGTFWYGFGLIAESYGDTDSALRYYERVDKSEGQVLTPASSYMLAQGRIAALRTVHK